jgi:hypothetical protein
MLHEAQNRVIYLQMHLYTHRRVSIISLELGKHFLKVDIDPLCTWSPGKPVFTNNVYSCLLFTFVSCLFTKFSCLFSKISNAML